MGMPYKNALIEIEGGLIEHAVRVDEGFPPYEYDIETFRACLQIFISALLWRLWMFNSEKELSEKARIAEECGNKLRCFIMDYSGIDSHNLYGEQT